MRSICLYGKPLAGARSAEIRHAGGRVPKVARTGGEFWVKFFLKYSYKW